MKISRPIPGSLGAVALCLSVMALSLPPTREDRTVVNDPDSVFILSDTPSYLCSYDGILLDGVDRKKIFKSKDKEMNTLIANIEKDVRAATYLRVYFAGFVETAGATWYKNDQIIIYNSEKLKKLRQQFPNKDSLKLILKALLLHELGHHTLPASVKLLARPVSKDSLKIFELDADRYMGQQLNRIYRYPQSSLDYVIKKLIATSKVDATHGTIQERQAQAYLGWTLGGFTYAFHSPLYDAFYSINKLPLDEGYKSNTWSYASREWNESDTLTLKKGRTASFRTVDENGRKFLEVWSTLKSAYIRIGTITDYSSPFFNRLVYDKYYWYWYITPTDEVWAPHNDEFVYMGKL